MSILPEFRVTLTRLKKGEQAYPTGKDVPLGEYSGRRTKLGGLPDYEQGNRPLPKCPKCKKEMTFVAQIDSVEHDTKHNPHAVDCLSEREPKWMFGDVGMIYVYFCYKCLEPLAEFECG